ncbi:hypothetical protein [Lentisalinibacter orientalis]|uniref:hypothetical protein n=1 Tax=Lentisalinibacter orientalis TaxID=2992241 RepID=UPI003863FDE7
MATGPHSGTVTGGCYPENYVLIKYDEGSNSWSLEDQTTTGLPNGGHGYDLTSIDPTTGDVYVSVYNSNGLWRRNGIDGSWTKVGDNPIISCNAQTCASGSTWDIRRNGYLRFGDSSESGVTIWRKDEANWSQLAPASEFGGFNAGYHFWAGYHRTSGIVWLHDGNGSSKHWRLNANDSIEALRPPPISLGCCGNNGRFTTYDFRTDRFVVADPYTNRFYDYDVEDDVWTSLGTKVPLNQSGAPEAFVAPIDAHGGVIMYVVGRGTGNDPKVYVYKHAGAEAPEQSTPEAPKDFGAN